MKKENLFIDKLEGFSGIRLRDQKPLVFKPGINLLIGRNGCGKTNLLRLVQLIATGHGDLSGYIESSYFNEKAKASLENQGTSILEKFDNVTLVSHSLRGKRGHLKLSLKNVTEEYVLRNIIRDPQGYRGHISLRCKTKAVRHLLVQGNIYPPKFEMSGYIGKSNLFSRESDNAVHSSIQDPMQLVSDFIEGRLKEFYESDDFVNKILNFEKAINEKFRRFLEKTNKRVKIDRSNLSTSGRISLELMDNENFVQSAHISTGEATLFNLVFSLTSAKQEGYDILSLDEPDIHMHDDMIRVLVSELLEVTEAHPSCIIIVASHSTALIEQLAALERNKVHIITFDNDRRVGNSEHDIELINALERNGVHFSPLMLSKRKNIFIENQFEKGKSQKDFLSRFFLQEDMPNIIPIGNSGNVQDNKSFSNVFGDILRIDKLDSFGIQDGDIWLKPRLVKYLKGELELSEFLDGLKLQDGIYISQGKSIPNAYYFNFWEIENLYLMDETLPRWKLKNGSYLTKSSYKNLLKLKRAIISDQYFNTFFKHLTRIKIDRKYSIQEMSTFLNKKFQSMKQSIVNTPELEIRMDELVDSILDINLLNWVPGKEVRKLLLNEGYEFEEENIDFTRSNLALEVRKILIK